MSILIGQFEAENTIGSSHHSEYTSWIIFTTKGYISMIQLILSLSRKSFWNHSTKKWSDITTLFILNDNIICFIAFLDVFSTKNGCNQKTQNQDSRTPPPLLAVKDSSIGGIVKVPNANSAFIFFFILNFEFTLYCGRIFLHILHQC